MLHNVGIDATELLDMKHLIQQCSIKYNNLMQLLYFLTLSDWFLPLNCNSPCGSRSCTLVFRYAQIPSIGFKSGELEG